MSPGSGLLPERIVQWCPAGVDGPGWDEFWSAASVESDVPALAVHDGVVIPAQQAHIADFRLAPVEPMPDVVRFAVAGWALTGGKGTSLIALAQSVAQGGGGEALVASDVQGHGVGAEDHGDYAGIAGKTAGFGGGELPAGVQGRWPQAVDEVAQAHGEDQMWALPAAGGQRAVVEKPGHGFDEGVCIPAGLAAGIGNPVDRGATAVE